MQMDHMTFDGFGPGETDFATRFDASPPELRAALDAAIVATARSTFSDIFTLPFTSLFVIGHSDRQDLPGMSHQDAHASEAAASLARAESAIAWLKVRLDAATGTTEWTHSKKLSRGWAAAGAGMLVHPNPSSEDERRANRRVTFYFHQFDIFP
jgi:hypothetical protein